MSERRMYFSYASKTWAIFGIIIFLFFYGTSCNAQETVYKIDVSHMNWEEQALFGSVQGIVNKDGAHIFLRFDDADDKWQNYYHSRYGLNFVSLSDPYQLLTIFAGKIKGYIVWDYTNLDGFNVAATLAGLNDWILVSKYLEDRVKAYGIPKKEDLSQTFNGMTKAQVYDWAFENYWDQCNKKFVSSLPRGELDWVSVDITPYVNGSDFYIRFEDAIKSDGNGAKLRSLKIIQGGNEVVSFRTGTDAEKTYLYDADGSWFDPEGDRIADANQYFVYHIQLSGSGNIILKFLAFNQYMVKVGNSPSGPFTTVSFSSKVTGSTIWGNRELDMAIFYRTFCFDLSSRQSDYPDEYAVKEKIMEAMEHPGIVLGWVSYQTGRDDEGAYVTQASIHGNAVICSGASNFSFHYWIKPENFTPPPLPEVPEIDENKIYVSFVLSDGDAYHWTNGFQGRQYLSTYRGSVPFGWELQPLLYDMAPAVLQYYYETATDNDDFVASASGIAYCHPEEFPPDRLEKYLQETQRYLERTGLRSITILSSRNISFELATKYHQYFKDLAVGCEEGYEGRGPEGGYPFTDFTVWRTMVPTKGAATKEDILEDLNNIAQSKSERPLFVPVHPSCYNTSYDGVKWITEQLDPNVFQVVKPAQLLQMLTQYYSGKMLLDNAGGVIPVLKKGTLFYPINFRTVIENPIDVNVNLEMPEGITVTAYQTNVRSWQEEMSRAEFRIQKTELLSDSGIVGTAQLNFSSEIFENKYNLPVILLDYQPEAGHYCELIQSWDAIDLAHRFGQKVGDSTAINGTAWYASKDDPEAPNHCIFGPYKSLPAGNYVACFRLKTGEITTSSVAVLDVFCDGIKLAAKYLRGTDFSAENKYQFFYLPFKHKGQGEIETRVYSRATADLWIDEIIILKEEQMGGLDGPSQGMIGDTLSFSVRAFDANNDSVAVRFDWGDGDSSSWSDYELSGYLFTMTHVWSDTGAFEIRFKTRDIRQNESDWSEPLVVTITENTTDIEQESQVPQNFILSQNYPNPFNPLTNIRYTLPESGPVTLTIYNIFGQKIRTLVDNVQTAGTHKVIWDGKNDFNMNVASGIYLYQIKFKEKRLMKKMILLR